MVIDPDKASLLPKSNKARAPNLIKSLKIILPSSRAKIVGLRENAGKPITNDPLILGPMIKNLWGPGLRIS
jgi:hypothetical protein